MVEVDGVEMVCLDFTETMSQPVSSLRTMDGAWGVLDAGRPEHTVEFTVRMERHADLNLSLDEHEVKLTRGQEVTIYKVVITGVSFDLSASGLQARVSGVVRDPTVLIDSFMVTREPPEPEDPPVDLRLGGLSEWDE